MSPRPNVSEERISQIVTAAEDVFTRKGFNEARMDDIAEETGLSKGTLYNYFKSKDDLSTIFMNRLSQPVQGHIQNLHAHFRIHILDHFCRVDYIHEKHSNQLALLFMLGGKFFQLFA